MRHLPQLAPLLLAAACTPLDTVGRAPQFTPMESNYEHAAMYSTLPVALDPVTPTSSSSLWTSRRSSLLGDHRASARGDILTVVVEIDDEAKISDQSDRERSGSNSLGVTDFFGIPQRVDPYLPTGATLGAAVSTNGATTYSGSGSVSRNETLTLRLAATIVEELPNGILRIEGHQELRVNYEMRDLVVSGYVRPQDISRQNEITYDKIADAQISYGGRGQLMEMQQPAWGQQILDKVLPF
jgi:flagellar L-ring protein precursor FlgH